MTDTITISQLFCDVGVLVKPHHNALNIASLSDFDITEILCAFRKQGLVLFRGFSADIAAFRSLSEKLCTNFRVHLFPNLRGSASADQTIQTALKGNQAVALHKELSFTPLSPDVVWFYCEEPPPSGTGETLVCDGVTLYARLADDMRQLFARNRLKYTQRWHQASWENFLSTSDFEEARRRISAYPGIRLHGFDDAAAPNTIFLDYVVSAISQTRFGSLQAFANSILMTASYGRSPSVSFEDGTLINDRLRQNIEAASRLLAHPISWRKDDILLIDNTRVMHGRTAFSGKRTILTRLADLQEQYTRSLSCTG